MPATPDDEAATDPKPVRRAVKRSKATTRADPELRLTGDRLVVRPPGNGERTSNSGLLIPATAMPAPKRLSWASVVLTGPDVRAANQGDSVLYLPASGLEVEIDGEELILLRERDVQAVSTTPRGSDRPPGQYL